jgi:hypothetical protein
MSFGAASLFAFLVSIALMFYVRRISRSSLIVDTLMRTALPLAAAQGILLYAGTAAVADVLSWWWVAIQLIFLGQALYMLVPSIFMARVAGQTNELVIVSRGLLEGLHVKLDQMYGPAPTRIINYSVGKQAGYEDVRTALGGNMIPPGGLWRWLPYIFRLTGLGRVKYGHLRSGDKVVIRVRDGFEVFRGHGHDGNTCDLTRGYLAGIGKALHPGMDCQAEETRCAQADGSDECEFVLRWFEPVKAPPPGA